MARCFACCRMALHLQDSNVTQMGRKRKEMEILNMEMVKNPGNRNISIILSQPPMQTLETKLLRVCHHFNNTRFQSVR